MSVRVTQKRLPYENIGRNCGLVRGVWSDTLGARTKGMNRLAHGWIPGPQPGLEILAPVRQARFEPHSRLTVYLAHSGFTDSDHLANLAEFNSSS